MTNYQKENIVIRGRIREEPVWDTGCLGKINTTRRMYIVPVIQQLSF